MWGSDKLAACEVWARREYAWLYPLADANGCFELTSLRVIWGKVAANRPDLSLQRLQEVFEQFTRHGLLFTWVTNGKRYGHWTRSEGRLPPRSERRRHKSLAPDIPVGELAKYLNSFGIKEVSNVLDLGRDLVLVRDLDLVEERQEAASPPGVPVALWLSFVEVRRSVRKPLTGTASELIWRELASLKERGHDPIDVLEQSIRNSWPDVYPVKEKQNGARQPGKAEQRRDKGQEISQDIFGRPSGLVGALHSGLEGRSVARIGAGLPGDVTGHSAVGAPQGVPARRQDLQVPAKPSGDS